MSIFWKKLFLITVDVAIVCISWILAIFLASNNFYEFFAADWKYVLIAVVIAVAGNFAFGFYNKMLRYIGTMDIAKMLFGSGLDVAVFAVVAILSDTLNAAWCVVCSIIYVSLFMGSRLSFKIVGMLERYSKTHFGDVRMPRVMIIGAGSAGYMLINEFKTSDKVSGVPVCVLDDNEKKIGLDVYGVRVVGKINEVEKFAKIYDVDQIIIAMPSVPKKTIKDIVIACRKTKCKVSILPGIYQIVKGSVSVSDVKDVKITDLLGRDQVNVNIEEILGYIENKVILVTGGGGSIGSELCRQIAAHKPKQLIIVDIYENNAYDIQQELLRKFPALDLKVRIASVRDAKKVDEIFAEFHPQIVYHAAAHKHVPLMEDSPNEAVKNNVGGTFNVSDAAGRYKADRFILISTDKAVNPTNIMGATKRLCEMIIQTMNKTYDTEYVAVRFGNVLGSNGSVIPLFAKQIEEGGPVTVTHKDIVRYFMTISEAVSLVLQAGAYAKGGEIFVLDMGEQVKIYDLAENMIRLSGFEPNVDIDIKVVGLRPGEKLYEERLMDEEGLKKTANSLISIGKPLEFNDEGFFDRIKDLCEEAKNGDKDIKEKVHELVPTYKVYKK